MASAVLSSNNLLFTVDGTNVQMTATSGSLSLGNAKITSVTMPTGQSINDNDVANRSYVDSQVANAIQGLDVKDSCVVATTANIDNLSSVTSQIDGQDLADNDRVLVKDQNTQSQNGIYVFTSSNDTLTRADDMAAGSSAAGAFTFIEKGTTNADRGFVCSSNADSDTVGTHDLVFTQFSGAGSITAAQDGGLEMNGTAISIKSDGVTNAMIADNAVDSDQIADGAVGSSQLASESAQTVTIADGDRFILNDNGTMKQVNVTALKTYTTTSGAAAVFGAITATSLTLASGNAITNLNSGTVVISGNVAGGTGVFQSNGNNDLTLQTGNSTTGSITITDGANGNIAIVPNGTGEVVVGASNGDQSLDIASHNLSDRGLKLGGTLVTSSAAELNILDGGTQTSSVTIQDGDGIILNDGGVMKQIPASDLKTYTATSSGVSKEATQDSDDLTIELTGNYDSSLILSSTGTGNDAIQIMASAGGMDIIAAKELDITTSANNANITIDPHGSGTLALGSADNTAVTLDALALTLTSVNALTLTDGTASLVLGGTGATSLSGATTVDLDCTGALSLNSSAGVINIGNDAVAQAINIGTGAAARTITVGNTTGATALDVNLGTGGLTVDCQDGGAISLDAHGAPSNLTLLSTADADDLTIALTGDTNSSLILSSTGTGADAVQLTASAGGMQIETATSITINSLASSDDPESGGAEEVVKITNTPSSGNNDDTILLSLEGNTDTSLGSGMKVTDADVYILTTENGSNLGAGQSILTVDTSAGDMNANSVAAYIRTPNPSQNVPYNGLLVDGGGAMGVRMETDSQGQPQDKLMKFYHDGTNGVVETDGNQGGGSIRFKNDILLATTSTNIAVNDVIGALNFQAPDEGTGSDANLVCAGIEAKSEGDFSATNNATKLSFKTGASETAAEKMSLSSSGNLTVTGTVAAATGSTIGNLTLADGSITSSSGAISFGNENLTTTGTVAAATGSTIGDLTLADGSITSSSGAIDFGDDNLTTTGTITSSSDVRLKKDIVEIDNCVDKVKKLRGVNFKWIQDDREDFGVIAQEVEEVAPHAVIENKEGMKSVDYGRLTTLLIQAVKEQQTQIEELKDLVTKLTSKE